MKIVGNAVVLTSILTVAVIETLKKFSPESLKKRDDKGNVLFAIGYNPNATSVINNAGVTYTAGNTEGYAQLTMNIMNDVPADKRKDVVLNQFGKVLYDLASFEPEVQAAYDSYQAKISAVGTGIEVLD